MPGLASRVLALHSSLMLRCLRANPTLRLGPVGQSLVARLVALLHHIQCSHMIRQQCAYSAAHSTYQRPSLGCLQRAVSALDM